MLCWFLLIRVAQNYFSLAHEQHYVEENDALSALRQRRKDQKLYDIVFVDCFQQGSDTPWACRSPEFSQEVRSVLAPAGVYVQNVALSDDDNPEVAHHTARLVHDLYGVFGFDCAGVSPILSPGAASGNVVLYARNGCQVQQLDTQQMQCHHEQYCAHGAQAERRAVQDPQEWRDFED